MVRLQKTKTLQNTLNAFRQEVINGVIQYRIENNTKWSKSADEKDYPKVITACEHSSVTEPGRSERGRSKASRVPSLHKDITKALENVAPPDVIVPQTKEGFHYGTCAEDDAATRVLNGLDKKNLQMPALNELNFIQPIRPRTLEIVPCCVVCEDIFG